MPRKIDILLFASLLGFFTALAVSLYTPSRVVAEHGECTSFGSADSIERCINTAKQNALDDCNNSSADRIEQCQRAVNEHYQTRPVDPPPSVSYDGDCSVGAGEQLDKDNCGIISYLVTFIRTLSAVVGIVVTIMIVWGGIMYSSSRDNPQQTAAARGHIVNALIALVSYLFFVAALNWLVPGGVF